MNETITLKITMKELVTLLLNHYKKIFDDENIKVIYNVTPYGESETIKTFIIKQTKVGDFRGESKYQLSDNEIKEVINIELEKSGYQAKRLNYYVVSETIEFDVVKKKQKQKKIGGIK